MSVTGAGKPLMTVRAVECFVRLHRVLVAVAVAAALVSRGAVVRGQGPDPAPILVVVNGASPNPYGDYLAEILRAEGVTAVDVVDLSSVTPTMLGKAKLAVLAETALSGGQATMFSNYVAGGGRLITMRPDARLATTLGITLAGTSTTDGYVLIDQSGPGAGLQSVTLPFKGRASHYTLAGATQVAELYSTRTSSAGRPAVVRYGRTAAWSFDLARSTVLTRQGDPALAGLERDGVAPYRTQDLFYGNVDLQRMNVPHADVQMRLFVRVVADLLGDAMPLPRLWYFPGTAKTLLVLTADAHTTLPNFYQSLITGVESFGGRISVYLPAFVPPPANVSPATLNGWRAAGHEFGLHPVLDNTTLAQAYQTNLDWFANSLLLTPGATTRHHQLAWQGWTDPVFEMGSRDIRMDLSYYAWGPTMYNPTQAQQAHGYVTGSGQPMRFIDASGVVHPVYQQATALVDEQLIYGLAAENLSPSAALAVSRQLIDESLSGGYSTIASHFHVDYYTFDEVKPWADGTMAYAQGLGIPMWTAEHWLRFTEARAGTEMTDFAWSAGTRQLTFSVRTPAGAETQGVLIPAAFQGHPLSALTLGGEAVSPTPIVVNGQALLLLPVPDNGGAQRTVLAAYADPATLPFLNAIDSTAPEGNAGASVGNLTLTLSAPSPTPVTAVYTVSAGSATAGVDFTPSSGLAVVPAGATTAAVPVTILGDMVDEPNETVVVTLTTLIGARPGGLAATLTVLDDDAPPVAVADLYGTPYQTPLVVGALGVLANDQSFGATGLAAQLVSPPENGSVVLNANGSFIYTPDAEFGGPDVFTYRASTVTGVGQSTKVTIDVAEPTTTQRPRNVRVFEMNGQVVTFRWSQGAGPAPVNYIFEGGVLPGQTLAAFSVGRNLPLLTLNAPVGSFFVRVRAVGANGVLTAPSVEIPVHIGVPVPPTAPAPLQAAVKGTSVALSWRNTFGGAAPTAVALDVAGAAVTSILLAPNETAVFGGVPPGTYNVSFRAGNGGGASAPSPTQVVTVPSACTAALGPPAQPLFYTVGSTVFGLWDPPTGGAAASAYVLDVTGYGLIPLAPGRRFTAAPPKGTYSVAVRAANLCAIGPPSAFQTVVVP